MTDGAGLARRMAEDHRDLDERWDRFEATPEGDAVGRRQRFRSFRSDLLEHIALEEEDLFPRMVDRDPGQRALVGRLLEEHARIKDVLDRLGAALEVGAGPGSVAELGFELRNELGEHNAREEAVAYPWLDGHLTAAETAEATRRLGRSGRP